MKEYYSILGRKSISFIFSNSEPDEFIDTDFYHGEVQNAPTDLLKKCMEYHPDKGYFLYGNTDLMDFDPQNILIKNSKRYKYVRISVTW